MKLGQKQRSKAGKYLTTGRKTNPNVLAEMGRNRRNEFRLPENADEEEFTGLFWEERRGERLRNRIGGCQKHQNYRSRLRLHLPERLHVPDVERLPGKSITDDIDPDYYALVTGRQIKVTKKIREYVNDIRNCFFTNLKIGYYADEILKAEEQHSLERKTFGEIKRKFEMYLKCFEEFLKSDHSSSFDLLKSAEAEKKVSSGKGDRVAELRDHLRSLESEMLVTEEKWTTYKSYQRFLYDISPMEWRMKHDDGFLSEGMPSTTSVPSPSDSEDGNLSRKIAKFSDVVSQSRAPALFFQNPEQVQSIFRELEKTNVIALIHCDNLEKPIQKMLSALERVKSELNRNQRMLREEIAYMRNMVEEEEAKAADMREKARSIVFGMYKDFIVSEENLNVTALVEDAYEDAIAAKDYEINVVEMMKEIEIQYEKLVLELDMYPYQVLVPTVRKFYRNEKIMEKEAREAERKVHLMEILLRRLSRSLTYPKRGEHRGATRKLLHRSEPRKEIFQKFEIRRIKTSEEKEFEYFFGRTCRNAGEAELCRPLCSISKTIFPGLD